MHRSLLLLHVLFSFAHKGWTEGVLDSFSVVEEYEGDYEYKEEENTDSPLLSSSFDSAFKNSSLSSNPKVGYLKLERALSNVTKVSGETVSLRCEVSGDPLPVKFRWFKNDAPLTEEKGRVIIRHYSSSGSVVGSRLRILQLDIHDTGFYMCEAFNDHQRVTTTAILLVKMNEKDRNPSGSNLDIYPSVGDSIPVSSDDKKEQGFCQLYRGSACSHIIGNMSIYVTSLMSQGLTEEKLAAAFTVIATSGDLSRRCADYAIPALCYHAFPLCDDKAQPPKPQKICQDECDILVNDICRLEYTIAQKHPVISKAFVLPKCAELPVKDTPDGKNCIRLGIPQLEFQIYNDTCYYDNGEEYRGCVSVSSSGLQCQKWSHQLSLKTSDYPELIGGHNCCRNPGGQEGRPWCFVVSDHTRREACDIPKCLNYMWLFILLILILLITLTGVLLCICCSRRRRKRLDKTKMQTEFPFSHQKSEINNLLSKFSAQTKEYPQSSIKFFDELGEGAFGKVYKGELRDKNRILLVAVKTLKENAGYQTLQDFKSEADVIADFDHPNIITLIGVCMKEEPICMIFEFMPHGDLHEFLASHSPSISINRNPQDPFFLDITELLYIAVQISSGMDYLASQHYVHRDLAARNCLVGENLTVKISDFGLSRDIYSTDYYRVQSKSLMPVRWMPPESILYGKFTSESDVWSFGVVLWEIFTYGLQPYYSYSNQEVIERVRSRHLLQCPDNCPPYIYVIMTECWQDIPSRRPSFKELKARLQSWQNLMSTQYTLNVSHSSSLERNRNWNTLSTPQRLKQSPNSPSKSVRSLPHSPHRVSVQVPMLQPYCRPLTPPQIPRVISSPQSTSSFSFHSRA